MIASTTRPSALDQLSSQEFATALRDHARNVAPDQPTTETILQRLAKHRPVRLELRKNGYSVKQILSFLRDPKFGITITETSLRRLLNRTPAEVANVVRRRAKVCRRRAAGRRRSRRLSDAAFACRSATPGVREASPIRG